MAEIDDSDLPDIFWPGKGSESTAPVDPAKAAQIAVELHYPEISAKQKRREEKRLQRSIRDEEKAKNQKPQYVRLSKKLQMLSMLLEMEGTFPAMDNAERSFCEKLLEKFRKYTPVYAKWITEKQYQWLKQISGRYIHIPGAK